MYSSTASTSSVELMPLSRPYTAVRHLGIFIDPTSLCVQRRVADCFAVYQLRTIRRSVPTLVFQSLVVAVFHLHLLVRGSGTVYVTTKYCQCLDTDSISSKTEQTNTSVSTVLPEHYFVDYIRRAMRTSNITILIL